MADRDEAGPAGLYQLRLRFDSRDPRQARRAALVHAFDVADCRKNRLCRDEITVLHKVEDSILTPLGMLQSEPATHAKSVSAWFSSRSIELIFVRKHAVSARASFGTTLL